MFLLVDLDLSQKLTGYLETFNLPHHLFIHHVSKSTDKFHPMSNGVGRIKIWWSMGCFIKYSE